MNSFILLSANLLLAAPTEPALTIPLRLERGQELVYHGVCIEESARPGARFTRHYTVESYVLILDVQARETRAAFLTINRLRSPQNSPQPPSARLQLGKIDATGRIEFSKRTNDLAHIPIQGPPSLESGAFVALPKDGLDGGKVWKTSDNPALQWSVVGMETVGCRCIRLLGEQRAANWDQAGQPSWRREDRIWLQLQSGFASKIERIIQQRDESGEIIQTSKTTLELENSYNPVFHPGGIFKVRHSTIERAVELTRLFDELQQPGGVNDQLGYDGLLNRIDFALKHATDTPYRAALVSLRRQAQAAHSGERPPTPFANDKTQAPPRPLAVGQVLPQVVLTSLDRAERIRLADLRGKPSLLVFIKGTSATIDYVLRYLAAAEIHYAGAVRIVPLVVEGESAVRARTAHLKIAPPLFDGVELFRALAGETTPMAIIADKYGTTRLIAPGWGGEYPDWFDREIQKILKP